MRLEDRIGYDLASLETFLTVYEAGSMAEAASKLRVTESAVSHTIRGLERRLDISLFDRSIRPIKPTPLGTQLYERGRRLLMEATGITHELRGLGQVAHARLRLGVIETMGTWFAGKLIRDLSPSALAWSMTIDSNDGLWRRFDARELDIAILIDDERGHSEADQRPLLRETGVLIAPATLPANLTIHELAAGYPLVGAHLNSGFGRLTSRYLSRLRIDKPLTCSLDSLECVLTLVSLGFGWAILPSLLLLRPTFERDGVRLQKLETPGLSRRIMLVTRKLELSGLADDIHAAATRIIQAQIKATRDAHPAVASILRIELDDL
jgi:DNA-binding transcriptional LysR family regulator